MEAREQFCRGEAARLSDRARATAGKVERTKNMVLYYLMSRDLKAIEGRESPCAPEEQPRLCADHDRLRYQCFSPDRRSY